jgi:hypothetical protein
MRTNRSLTRSVRGEARGYGGVIHGVMIGLRFQHLPAKHFCLLFSEGTKSRLGRWRICCRRSLRCDGCVDVVRLRRHSEEWGPPVGGSGGTSRVARSAIRGSLSSDREGSTVGEECRRRHQRRSEKKPI